MPKRIDIDGISVWATISVWVGCHTGIDKRVADYWGGPLLGVQKANVFTAYWALHPSNSATLRGGLRGTLRGGLRGGARYPWWKGA